MTLKEAQERYIQITGEEHTRKTIWNSKAKLVQLIKDIEGYSNLNKKMQDRPNTRMI